MTCILKMLVNILMCSFNTYCLLPPKICRHTSNHVVLSRDASIRYWVSVSAPIQSFSADRVSVRWDPIQIRSCAFKLIIFCVDVKPHGSHTNTIKHHTVFMHYISSVLELFHSLIWGTDECLSLKFKSTWLLSLRCVCLSSSVQHSNCASRSVTTVKHFKSAQSLRFKTVKRKGSK